MKFLVTLFICLHCNVSSRHITKRSEPPSSVYLPPPQETVVTDAEVKIEETTSSEPVAAVKLAETILVTESARETEAETEAPLEDSEEVVEAETEVPLEDPEEVIEAETEVPAEDPEEVTEGPESEAAEVYLFEEEETTIEAAEEDPIPDIRTEEIAEGYADESPESAGSEEVLPTIEPVDNLLNPRIVDTEEEVIVESKPVSGYWIEVSGDRDIVVRYQE